MLFTIGKTTEILSFMNHLLNLLPLKNNTYYESGRNETMNTIV